MWRDRENPVSPHRCCRSRQPPLSTLCFAHFGEQLGWYFLAVGGELVGAEFVDLAFGKETVVVGVHRLELFSTLWGHGQQFFQGNAAVVVGVGTGEGSIAAFAFTALAFTGLGDFGAGFAGTALTFATLAFTGLFRRGELVALRQCISGEGGRSEVHAADQ